MTFGREINLMGFPYILLDYVWQTHKIYRTALRHFQIDKNQLTELYNKATIIAQEETLGPKSGF